jgi:hypothetical protein
MLTFLSTILEQTAALNLLERDIPWQVLATFFGTIPRRVMTSQGLLGPSAPSASGDRWAMLTSDVSPPASEDWSMRGMEWVGRKIFERGYWKSGEDRKAELEVVDQNESVEVEDGTIEDDEDDDSGVKVPKNMSDLEQRWIRICRAAVTISGCVDGLVWKEGTREWTVEGKLAQKVWQWQEEDRVEKLEEDGRRIGRRWTEDAMEIDEAEMDEASSSDDDDENDSEEIKALKVRITFFLSKFFPKGACLCRLVVTTSRTSWLRLDSLPPPLLAVPALARKSPTTVPLSTSCLGIPSSSSIRTSFSPPSR